MMKRALCCVMLALVIALLASVAVSGARAEKSVRITFVGDVTLGSEERLWKESFSFVSFAQANGYGYFLENVKPLFEEDDLTVVNLEGVLSDSAEGENTKKTYRFRGPASFAQILVDGDVEVAGRPNACCGAFRRTHALSWARPTKSGAACSLTICPRHKKKNPPDGRGSLQPD